MPILEKRSDGNLPSVLLRRMRSDDAGSLDTEGGFSVGDRVTFPYHDGLITGYVVRFYRDSYLFYKDGECRPYADIVQCWEKRDLQGYGHAVVLSELRHADVAA